MTVCNPDYDVTVDARYRTESIPFLQRIIKAQKSITAKRLTRNKWVLMEQDTSATSSWLDNSSFARAEFTTLAPRIIEDLELRRHIPIVIEQEAGQFVVNTTLVDTYGVGETRNAAIEDFLTSLALDYHWLQEERITLSPHLTKTLNELETILSPV